ncbi:MAG: carboxypeptidase-like regulatory domain-containing protein [Planctomycetaceae bacterium]|nr:carboxypeptidase-like regulatory domain-containing protein [Planctomycetaceae bacterium]
MAAKRIHWGLVSRPALAIMVMFSQASAQDGFRFADVQLTQSGVLQGAVASAEGQPLASAVVEVRYQGKTIAVATSGANGQFAVSQVRPGVHEVVVGSHAQPVRIWASGAAPPQSQSVCRVCVRPASQQMTGPLISQSGQAPQTQPVIDGQFSQFSQPGFSPQASAVGCETGCPPTLPCGSEGCVQPVCEPVQPWGARFLPVLVAGTSAAALVLAIDAKDAADDALAAAVASP